MKYLKLFEQFDDPFGEESTIIPGVSIDDIIEILDDNNLKYSNWNPKWQLYDVIADLNENFSHYYLYFNTISKLNIFYNSFIEKYPTTEIRKELDNPILKALIISKRL